MNATATEQARRKMLALLQAREEELLGERNLHLSKTWSDGGHILGGPRRPCATCAALDARLAEIRHLLSTVKACP